ncbi:MAG: DUF4270 family protein [Bacteroidetes bacterium]|nr:DUF4270 family protein [Bacteroidota bacterium]
MIITKLNIKSKGLLPLFFLLVFGGCKKETTDIGVDILGDGNLNSIEVLITDISARSVRDDSSRTDNLSSNTLGVVNDPIFGLSKSCLIVQPRLTQFGTDDTPKSIDSVKLILKYDYEQNVLGDNNILKYGDINSVLVMDVYMLNEDLVDTVKYYSTFKPELGDIVGTFTGSFNFSDSTSLEIMLNNSFGQEMLDWNSDIYKDEAKFLKTLKGLVIVPRNNTLSGEGAIVCVEAGLNSSKLQLFYNDSLTKTIPMGSSSRRINYYETQPSVNLTNQFNSTNNFRTTYAQSFGGAKIKVDLAGLDSVIKVGEKVVINEAKITFLLDQISITDEFKAPSRMFLVVPDTLNSKYSMPIIDLTTTSNYGGDYNPVIKGYEFHFNRYLQQLVKEYAKTGKNNFNGFYLSIPSDYPVTPYRGVFKTDKDAGDIKVSITFTKLD